MLRRVREFLSKRKAKRWELTNPNGPVSWDNLPVEMRREIVKYTDIPERCRLRVCSKQDRDIVDSLPIKFPLVRFECIADITQVTFVHSTTKVVRVDVKRRKVRRNVKPFVLISRYVDGLHPIETRPKYPLDVILHSLFSFISQRNIKVETLSLSFEEPNAVLQSVLHELYVKGILNNLRIISSGVTFIAFGLQYMNVAENRVLYDIENSPEFNDPKIFMGRRISLDSIGYPVIDTYFTKCSTLKGNAGALIASVLWNIHGGSKYFLIPGYQEEDPVGLCERFFGQYFIFPGQIYLLSIPTGNDESKLMVKISKCGVVILKVRMARVPHSLKDYSDKTCGLGWMCKTCDESVESWYFRKTVKIE